MPTLVANLAFSFFPKRVTPFFKILVASMAVSCCSFSADNLSMPALLGMSFSRMMMTIGGDQENRLVTTGRRDLLSCTNSQIIMRSLIYRKLDFRFPNYTIGRPQNFCFPLNFRLRSTKLGKEKVRDDN